MYTAVCAHRHVRVSRELIQRILESLCIRARTKQDTRILILYKNMKNIYINISSINILYYIFILNIYIYILILLLLLTITDTARHTLTL